MNYYTLRIITFVLLLLILLVLIKFILKKKINNEKKYNRIKIIVLSIMLFISWYFPYEKTFIKFDTVESSFSYYFPSGRIIKEHEKGSDTYLLYADSGHKGFMYYEKTTNGWTFTKGKIISKTYNKYLITINEISSKDISGIIISYPVYDDEDLINDSLDNKFEKITQKDNLNGATFDTIFTTVDQLLDDKYTIYFGKQEYKPLN